MVRWMIAGKTFSCPVGSGRKLMLDNYIKYLEMIHGKHISIYDSDEHITIEDVIGQNYDALKNVTDGERLKFQREYDCHWNSESDKFGEE